MNAMEFVIGISPFDEASLIMSRWSRSSEIKREAKGEWEIVYKRKEREHEPKKEKEVVDIAT